MVWFSGVVIALAFAFVRGAAEAPMPDYSGVDSNAPVASTFFWFSSVEVGVCYAPKTRLPSVKGSIHCTHQEDYDVVNNTWQLPQTCIALRPLGSSLNSAIKDTCTSAGGTFNTIKPAPANADATSASSAITGGNGQQQSSTESTDTDDKKDSSLMSKLTMGLIG